MAVAGKGRKKHGAFRSTGLTRRGFLSAAAATGTLVLAPGQVRGYAANEQLQVALVGCGGRGTGAAIQALSNKATRNVKLVAMADAFREPLDNCFRAVKGRCGDQVDVPEERKFVDLDGFFVTGAEAEWILETPVTAATPGFAPYKEDRVDPLPLDFETLRRLTTGAMPVDEDAPLTQDNRPGVEGTFHQDLVVGITRSLDGHRGRIAGDIDRVRGQGGTGQQSDEEG